jgi:outer membrane lipoprotein-sorting protein
MNYLQRSSAIVLFCFTLLSSAQTAEEIIRKADEKYRGKSSYSEMTINIVRPKWSKQMKIKGWSEGTKYSVSIVTSPAKEKGTVFLMRDKEVWNYMPTIDRTIKFPPSMMLQNWMGTDLTNDDLVKQSSILEDYTHKIIREELKEGYTCWVIELTPKEDAPVVWGKVLIWVDKNDFMMLQTDYYDEDDFLVNQMIGSEIKEFSGKKLPSKLRVIPSENKGQETILIYDKLEFDISISEQYFTINYMKRIR